MQEHLFSNPVFYGVALTLFHFLWQGCLVALVLKALLMLTPTKNAQLRYGYSFMAMLANLVLPIITFSILYRPDYLQLVNQSAGTIDATNSGQISTLSAELWSNNWLAYFPSVTIVWLAGITALSTKLLIELYSVNQLSKQAAAAPDAELARRFDELARKLSLTKTPQLVISLKADVPMAIGWLKPVVLVPFSMLSGLTPMQLDMLLLHELAHIRRHDYLVNFMQTLVEILLFFHPCVKWVSKQMRNEREYCSDDIAVQHCGDAMAYAHTLADTASLCKKHASHSIPTMAMAASGGDLKQRVVRLVDQHHCASTNEVSKWFASIAIIAFVIALAIQNQIRLPHIDLNSGKIFLDDEPQDNIANTASVGPIEINKNSLASKFLEQDNIQQSTLGDTSLVSTDNLAKLIVAPKSSQDKNTNLAVDTSNEPVLIEADVTIEKQQIAKNTTTFSKKSDASNLLSSPSLAIEDAQPAKQVTIESKAPIATPPSITERAFERTDSSKKQSKIANPYANQIAALSNDVVKSDIALQLTETTKKQQINNVGKQIMEPEVYTTHVVTQTLPEVLYSVQPRYPSAAKRKGIELEVLVNFSIDRKGQVTNIVFLSKGKVSYFRSAIRTALEKWRFEPARKNGEAIESNMSKIFSFSLVK